MRSDNWESLIWGTVVILCVLIFFGAIVTYHAYDRVYMDHYVVGVETTVDENWVRYYINTGGMECDADYEQDSIEITCYP